MPVDRPFVFGSHRNAFQPAYPVLARALMETYSPETAMDFGTGQGWLPEALHDLGVDAHGTERDSRALEHMTDTARTLTSISNWVTDEYGGERYDLVSCVEVAEHIEPELTERLVEVLTSAAKDEIFFTAATPMMHADGHQNLRPHGHWLVAFDRHGFELDLARTRAMYQLLEPCFDLGVWWIPTNQLCLRRSGR